MKNTVQKGLKLSRTTVVIYGGIRLIKIALNSPLLDLGSP